MTYDGTDPDDDGVVEADVDNDSVNTDQENITDPNGPGYVQTDYPTAVTEYIANPAVRAPLQQVNHEGSSSGDQTGNSLSGGSTVTAASITGSGVVKNVWTALGNTSDAVTMLESYLEVVVDGQYSVFLSNNLNGFAFQANHLNPDFEWANAKQNGMLHFPSTGNINLSYSMRYPIPFESSIEVKVHNGGSAAMDYFVRLGYEEWPTDEVPNYRLKSSSQIFNRNGFDTISASSPYDFINLPSGTEGFLAGWNWAWKDADTSDRLRVENDINIYYDGESSPSWAGTGSEDFFDMAWVYQFGKNYWVSQPVIVGYNNYNTENYAQVIGTDFIQQYGGIPFSDGIRVEMETSSMSTDALTLYNLYYYERV
ncbi:DUF2961 [Halorubrum tailed virus 29]|uniref:DUF2961 n=1 Tax=Halorubrum tailed virus 29 TaxID=2878010 RepID=A0AAE8Y1S8_9CAUD|nr:DUF2961 [Halorubrum tailed virus 29]UBF23338.1 DUF2961 [Halorubrum tailed virus 29]